MKTDLITVPPSTSLTKARSIIEEKKISHLLVVDASGKLRGIVSDRDIKRSWASQATTLSVHELNYLLEQLTLEMIMGKTLMTTTPETTIERVAQAMQANRISALPVLDGDDLVGIITTTDVLRVLLQAIGIDKESARFTVMVRDRVGVMAEVCQLLKENDVNIRSLVTWPEEKHPGVYQLVLRVPAELASKAVKILEDADFTVLTEYIRDPQAYLPQ
jgi:acetoin utilization protein AcuB